MNRFRGSVLAALNIVYFSLLLSGQIDDIPTFSNCEDVGISDCSTYDYTQPIHIYLDENVDLTNFELIQYQANCVGSSSTYSLENKEYFGFTAYDETLDIGIQIRNCISSVDQTKAGGQVAALSSCADLSAIMQFNFCTNSGPRVFGDVDTSRIATGLTVGCEYYLLFDGYNGSGCEFIITFNNYTEPIFLPEISCADITNNNCNVLEESCENQTIICDSTSFTIYSDTLGTWGCIEYEFLLFDENNDTLDKQYVDFLDFQYQDFDAGTYYYQINANHKCDTISIIDTFYVTGVDTLFLNDEFLCPEDIGSFTFPPNWVNHGHVLTPGLDTIFTYRYLNTCRCNIVDAFHMVIPTIAESGIVDTLICSSFDPFDFNGIMVTSPMEGMEVLLPDASHYGCDSAAILNVYKPTFDNDFEIISCHEDSITIELELSNVSSFVDSFQLAWWQNNIVISNNFVLTIPLYEAVDLSIEWYVGQIPTCIEFVLTDHLFVPIGSGDFILPSYTCESSNDSILFIFDLPAYDNPALVITELSTYGGIQNGNEWLFTGLNEHDEVIFEWFTTIENICSTSPDTFSCSLDCVPYDIVFPMNGNTYCWNSEMAPIELGYGATPNFNEPANVLISPSTNLIGFDFIPISNVDSVYTFYLNYNEMDCSYLDSFNIEVFYEPFIEINTLDTSICISESIVLTDLFNVNGSYSTFEFDGVVDHINNSDINNFEVAWDNPGDYTIEYWVTTLNCESNKLDVMVTVEDTFNLNLECSNDQDGLHFSWFDIPCLDSFEIYINNQWIGFQTEPTILLDTFPSETTVEIMVVPMGYCQCAYSAQSMSCETADCPEISMVLNHSDTLICTNDIPNSYKLSVVEMNNPLLDINEIVWSGPNIDALGNIDIKSLALGTHQFSAEYIFDANCTYSVSIEIEMVELGITTFEIFQPKCIEETYGLVVFDQMANGNPDSIFINGIKVPWITEMYFDLGNSDVLIQNNDGCEEQFGINIIPPTSQTIAIIGNDGTIINGENVSLSYTSSVPMDSVAWYIEGTLICSGVDCNPILLTEFDSELVNICIEGYFFGACQVSQCIELKIEEPASIFIPNIISLNDDGVNGNWIIGSNQDLEIVKVEVFDRWGNKVFEDKNVVVNGSHTLWDGKYNGESVVSGVYIYSIEFLDEFGQNQHMVDDITIIR